MELDALIVGAGPTGLTLAAQLRRFGARLRIVDRLLDRAHESRALAVQARSLEVLQCLGLADELVARGNPSARLVIHLGERDRVEVRLGGIGAADTRFPFILFVSQAVTEQVLDEHLRASGVEVERGVELVTFADDGDGVRCVLRHRDGKDEHVRTRYLAGCDGAHSTVRKGAGIPFEGDAYPQDFVLGDVEIDGPLAPGAINAYPGQGTFAMIFPLGRPATWRVIASPGVTGRDAATTSELSLAELQAVVAASTGGALRVRDPAWLTHFRLHHRMAARYRAGRAFLAGDAAHIHSPAGAQGMNTGIQDAWNLGWKLALAARGVADDHLLDSYEAERVPVGRFLLRFTDRLFGVFATVTSKSGVAAWLRRTIAPLIIPRVLASERLRRVAFRIVSQLGIRYRRSPAVAEGAPRLRAGPRAGDRLPEARLARDGQPTWLQRELAGPCYHLLLCGPVERWDAKRVAELVGRYPGLLAAHYLSRSPGRGVLTDTAGEAFARLGVEDAAQYAVRPDGHVAFRCAGWDLQEVADYLGRWLRPNVA